ncbi:MAG TPA: efflux RND transporter periplasmic adaptor subunit [Thermoanaerobaculia bacterium]
MNIDVRKTWGSRVLALLLPLTLAAGLAGCTRGESNEPQAAPDLAKVERHDLSISADASGLIEPLRIVEVKSKVSGEVKAIHAETGMELPQGTLIAEIDPRDVRNNLAQMQADIALAQARVETTSAQRRRAEQLSKAGVISAQDLENTQLEETNARAQLVKAKTNLELAQEKMGDVTIRAPIAGTVIEKTVEQGQIIASASGNVSGGTTLVKMADLSIVQARALVDEVDIGRIQPGQRASVTVEAYPGRTFRGSVAKIEPQAVVEQNVTMFPVLVQLENPERLLKPGMNSEVSIDIADRHQVVAIPNESVVNPREAATAGEALGLDEEQLRAKMAEMRRVRDGRQSSGGSAGTAGEARSREGRGGQDDGRGSRGGHSGSRGGAAFAGAQPGVVFIKGPNGPEPKFVLLGLSDLDYTEVLRGVEPGQEVYLISVARLKQQQEQFANRMRERAGGGMFGSNNNQSGGQSGSSQGGQSGGSQGGSRP